MADIDGKIREQEATIVAVAREHYRAKTGRSDEPLSDLSAVIWMFTDLHMSRLVEVRQFLRDKGDPEHLREIAKTIDEQIPAGWPPYGAGRPT